MPKMKSHSGAAKRFSRRKSGSIRRKRGGDSHNYAKKSSKTKRDLRKTTEVDSTDLKRVNRMLAY